MTMQVTDERRGFTSASNAAADLACPGRHLAQKGLPGRKTPDSEYGRIIHTALADSGKAENLTRLSQDQRDIFDQCRTIEKKLMLQLFPEAGSNAPVRVFREQRYWCKVPVVEGTYDKGFFEHSGQADMIARCGPQALIADYKTLPGEVEEAPGNLQLRDLAVLARGNLLVDEVAAVIIQPLVTMDPKVCFYGPDDLKRAEAEMFTRVRASNNPASLRHAGEVACKFCLAKTHCLQYQQFAGSNVPAMLSILDVPIQAWTPEQRGLAASRLGIAQKWLDEVKEHLKEGLKSDPNFVPGFYLAPGAKREAITDAQGVWNRFAALGGKVESFLATVSVRKGTLREQLSALTGAKGKALDQAMSVLTAGFVEVSQNEPSLKAKEEQAS